MKVEVHKKCLLEILLKNKLNKYLQMLIYVDLMLIYIYIFIDLYTTKFRPVDSPQLRLPNYLEIVVLYDDIPTI